MMTVDVMSPDARKKVDELFLYWLSEPSTQDLLRHEVAKVCGLQQQKAEHLLSPTSSKRLRPASPTARALTPPLPSPTLSPCSRAGTKRNNHVLFNKQQVIVEERANGLVNEVISAGKDEIDYVTPPAADNVVEMSPAIITKTSAEPSSSKIPTIVLPEEPIPQFYFPNGKLEKGKKREMDKTMINVGRIFERYARQEVPRRDFHLVVKALKLPFYWKAPLFKMVAGKNKKYANLAAFKRTWSKIIDVCHDDASRFVSILTFSDPDRNYLIPGDFEPIVQDIVDSHPGLEFLRAAPEFHARYVETVIGRIFYTVDKSWMNRISVQDLRNSNFLQRLSELESESNINKFTSFFSYEHFYVIYCKFWELDTDHDLLIDANDFIRHSDHCLTYRVVERLLSGVVTRDLTTPPGKMSYKDFVWFLISEEDKTTNRSIEYWFRILDKDGDGVLSIYELEYFYEDILARLEELNIESLSVENTICQVLDMINPKQHNYITLRDLKNSKLTPFFLNTFINVDKYLDYEQREAVAPVKDETDIGSCLNDWEKFASEQYELLVAEENDDEDHLNEEYDDELIDSDTEMDLER